MQIIREQTTQIVKGQSSAEKLSKLGQTIKVQIIKGQSRRYRKGSPAKIPGEQSELIISKIL